MLSTGEVVGGKYRVLGVLGSGGMGVVYEAQHLTTDRQIALKCLHPDAARAPEAAARLAREARASGRIHHPNVVAVHDCGEHLGQLYLVMERLRGSSLRRWAAGRAHAPEEACRVLFPVLRGVAAAHAAGVLHRDLKPENVFMTASPDGLAPVPKVLDFGLARFRDGETCATLSATGTVMGTYQYMAPEQLRSQVALDERADVYALGVMAYELLTGRLPYRADNPVDLALQILEAEPAPVNALVPSLPEALASVIGRAIARDRNLRFGTVDDFAGALEAFAGGQPFRGSGASAVTADPVAPPLSSAPSAATVATALPTTLRAPSAPPRRPAHVGLRGWLVAGGSSCAVAAVIALALGGRSAPVAQPVPVVPAATPAPAAAPTPAAPPPSDWAMSEPSEAAERPVPPEAPPPASREPAAAPDAAPAAEETQEAPVDPQPARHRARAPRRRPASAAPQRAKGDMKLDQF